MSARERSHSTVARSVSTFCCPPQKHCILFVHRSQPICVHKTPQTNAETKTLHKHYLVLRVDFGSGPHVLSEIQPTPSFVECFHCQTASHGYSSATFDVGVFRTTKSYSVCQKTRKRVVTNKRLAREWNKKILEGKNSIRGHWQWIRVCTNENNCV